MLMPIERAKEKEKEVNGEGREGESRGGGDHLSRPCSSQAGGV